MREAPSGGGGEGMSRAWGLSLVGLLAAAAFLLYGTFTWRPPEPSQPLKVAIGVWPGSETLVYARESGMLRREDVQLVEMAWSSATKVAFVNRVVDAAAVSLDEVLRLLESRTDFRVVMVFGFSDGGDAVMARPGTRSVAELRGRRIGVEANAVGSFILNTALEQAGVRPDEVETVSMNLAEMEAAYLAGELDAVVTGEPWTIRLEANGAVELFSSRQMNRDVCRVLVVREDVLRDRPEDLSKLVAAHFQALPLLRQGGDPAVLDIIRRRLGVTEPEFQSVLTRMQQPDLPENLRLLEGKPPALRPLADRVAERMVRQKLLASAPGAGAWLTGDCIKGVVR